MSTRLASFLVLPAILTAGGAAYYGAEAPVATADGVAPIAQAPAAMTAGGEVDPLPPDHGETLPPNHPPIGAGDSLGATPSPPAAAIEAPAIAWKMPAGWQEARNPSAMRLITYGAPGGVEVSVSRAGGTTDANIQRWIAQFDAAGREGRVEKVVHGLHVVTVDVAGTYLGGGMGAPAEARADWAMVGAIIEGVTPPYFFKMTGPAAAVLAARPAFDRLVDGIAPL